MKECKIIYQGNNSGCHPPITEFNTLQTYGLSVDALHFSYLAIELSKRHKADLRITAGDRLRTEFFIQIGDFAGKNKELFAKLIELSDDMLILPDNSSDFMLKVNMFCRI